jgi:hypothetical protein
MLNIDPVAHLSKWPTTRRRLLICRYPFVPGPKTRLLWSRLGRPQSLMSRNAHSEHFDCILHCRDRSRNGALCRKETFPCRLFRELSRSLHGRRHELKSSAAEILKVCTQHLGAGGRLPVPYSDFCFSQAMNPSRSSAGMMSYGASPIDLA